MTKIQNKNEAELNKKPAFEADSSESRNDSSSSLTSAYIIANQDSLSRPLLLLIIF
jgi:hypothetical protein